MKVPSVLGVYLEHCNLLIYLKSQLILNKYYSDYFWVLKSIILDDVY